MPVIFENRIGFNRLRRYFRREDLAKVDALPVSRAEGQVYCPALGRGVFMFRRG
jgi:hypothetical protein